MADSFHSFSLVFFLLLSKFNICSINIERKERSFPAALTLKHTLGGILQHAQQHLKGRIREQIN